MAGSRKGSLKRMSHHGKIGPTISTMVRANPGEGVNKRFFACARVGKQYDTGAGDSKHNWFRGATTVCTKGKNPRAAIKKAVGILLNGRKGTFSGLSKKKGGR